MESNNCWNNLFTYFNKFINTTDEYLDKIEPVVCLGKDDLEMKRPGDGISPMKIENIIGLSVAQDLQKDHKLELKDLKN